MNVEGNFKIKQLDKQLVFNSREENIFPFSAVIKEIHKLLYLRLGENSRVNANDNCVLARGKHVSL